MMQRAGWTPDTFAVGDAVTIDVNPTRDAERRMARGIVVRPAMEHRSPSAAKLPS